MLQVENIKPSTLWKNILAKHFFNFSHYVSYITTEETNPEVIVSPLFASKVCCN